MKFLFAALFLIAATPGFAEERHLSGDDCLKLAGSVSARYLNKAFDENALRSLKAAQPKLDVQVLHPGESMTKDFIEERLNLQVEKDSQLLKRAWCG